MIKSIQDVKNYFITRWFTKSNIENMLDSMVHIEGLSAREYHFADSGMISISGIASDTGSPLMKQTVYLDADFNEYSNNLYVQLTDTFLAGAEITFIDTRDNAQIIILPTGHKFYQGISQLNQGFNGRGPLYQNLGTEQDPVYQYAFRMWNGIGANGRAILRYYGKGDWQADIEDPFERQHWDMSRPELTTVNELDHVLESEYYKISWGNVKLWLQTMFEPAGTVFTGKDIQDSTLTRPTLSGIISGKLSHNTPFDNGINTNEIKIFNEEIYYQPTVTEPNALTVNRYDCMEPVITGNYTGTIINHLTEITTPASVTYNYPSISCATTKLTHNGSGTMNGWSLNSAYYVAATGSGGFIGVPSAYQGVVANYATSATSGVPTAMRCVRFAAVQNSGATTPTNEVSGGEIYSIVGGTSTTPCTNLIGAKSFTTINSNVGATIPKAIGHIIGAYAGNNTTTLATVTEAYGLAIGDPAITIVSAGIGGSNKAFDKRASSLSFTTTYGIWMGTSDGTTKWNLYITDAAAKSYIAGKVLIDTAIDDTVNKLQVNGSVLATQYRLSAFQTAPSSANDTGTSGEIRITSDAIYVCISTNSWVKATLSTW